MEVKEEEKERPILRDDSTFLDEVQVVKYEDYSEEVV